MIDRRRFLAIALGVAFLGPDAVAKPPRVRKKKRRKKRRRKRRVRRRVRRRHRRRVRRRTIRGRRLWVVPVAAVVGWELALDNRVVVVHEVRKTPDVEVIVVKVEGGGTEEIEVHREDDAENAKELEGTQLPDGDTSTPARETTEEVEVTEEVDEEE